MELCPPLQEPGLDLSPHIWEQVALHLDNLDEIWALTCVCKSAWVARRSPSFLAAWLLRNARLRCFELAMQVFANEPCQPHGSITVASALKANAACNICQLQDECEQSAAAPMLECDMELTPVLQAGHSGVFKTPCITSPPADTLPNVDTSGQHARQAPELEDPRARHRTAPTLMDAVLLQLIRIGADPNAKQPLPPGPKPIEPLAPLLLASTLGLTSAVHALVAGGALPDITTRVRQTPLHKAKSAAVAHALLAAGAAVDARDESGKTPLHTAILELRSEVAQVLLVVGRANPNALDSIGRSALHHACRIGTSETVWIVPELLGHGADILLMDRYGCSALDYAPRSGYKHVLAALKAAEETAKRLRRLERQG